MDCSTPGFPVLLHLPELVQTHVHWVGDAIQPCCTLSSPSPALNLSQHQGLFQWVSSLYQVVRVLELQHQSSQWIFRTHFLCNFLLISLQSKGLSRVFSSTTVQKHQFFNTQPSLWPNSHIHTWWLKKTIALTRRTFVSKVVSLLFNMLSRFVIAFLPRSKHLLILWLQSPSAVIFGCLYICNYILGSISMGDQDSLKTGIIIEFLCWFWRLNMSLEEISGEELRLTLMKLDVLWGACVSE